MESFLYFCKKIKKINIILNMLLDVLRNCSIEHISKALRLKVFRKFTILRNFASTAVFD